MRDRVMGAGMSLRARQGRRTDAVLELLSDAERVAGIGSFEWDIEADHLIWSPELYRMYGVPSDGFDGNLAGFLRHVHPDDVARVSSEVNRAVRDLGSFELEERIVRTDGAVRVLATRGEVLADDHGRPRRVVGICRDVTDLRAWEEALTWMHQRYRVLIECSSDIVSVIAENGSATYVGGPTERLLGYAPDELLNGRGFRLVHPDDIGRLEEALGEVAETIGATRTVEYRMLRRDGTWCWLEAVATNRFDEPTLRGIVINHRDVTARRAADAAAAHRVLHESMTGRPDRRFIVGRIGRGMDLELAVRRAADDGHFVPHYQPIVELATGAVQGYEALLRWPRGRRYKVSPAQVIAIAEAAGVVGKIDVAMLHQATRQAAAWQTAQAGGAPLTVSVNLSPTQLVDPCTVGVVRDALDGARIDPTTLCLEITESSLVLDSASAAVVVRALKDLGVRIALDDFGTGYAMLAYLKRFPVDVLKIDRSFVAGLGAEAVDRSIVRSIVQLAGSLGVDAVAEGVERQDQLEELLELGCRLGQGYVWSPALPADEATAWGLARPTPR